MATKILYHAVGKVCQEENEQLICYLSSAATKIKGMVTSTIIITSFQLQHSFRLGLVNISLG